MHLSSKVPKARAEKDWYPVMERYLTQLAELKDKYKCEVVYAGDIFDDWRVDAELINFALKWLPSGYAVPGQHELPHHRYEDRHKSPYWTLVQAEKIENIPANQYRFGPNYILHGWPWGSEVKPNDRSVSPYKLQVAVIHAYCWSNGKSYPNAPNKAHVKSWASRLQGYDVAVFGDNHKGFVTGVLPGGHDGPYINILNNGFFIPRTADEKDHHPCVGVVYTNGFVEQIRLDRTGDKWLDEEEACKLEAASKELDELLKVLKDDAGDRVDFVKTLLRSLSDQTLGRLTKEVIVRAIEETKK